MRNTSSEFAHRAHLVAMGNLGFHGHLPGNVPAYGHYPVGMRISINNQGGGPGDPAQFILIPDPLGKVDLWTLQCHCREQIFCSVPIPLVNDIEEVFTNQLFFIPVDEATETGTHITVTALGVQFDNQVGLVFNQQLVPCTAFFQPRLIGQPRSYQY